MSAALFEVLGRIIPKVIEWVVTAAAERRDPERELDTWMFGAEEAARLAESRKFGQIE